MLCRFGLNFNMLPRASNDICQYDVSFFVFFLQTISM
uniref:Uncharacterized protein n=1 Tax=Arundo donax TaxID=35708 RepID=A0A0A9HAS9_ARUDO